MNSTFTAFLTFSEGGRLGQNEHYRHDKSRIYAVMLAAALDCTCAPVIKWPLSVYPVSHTKSLFYCHKKKKNSLVLQQTSVSDQCPSVTSTLPAKTE